MTDAIPRYSVGAGAARVGQDGLVVGRLRPTGPTAGTRVSEQECAAMRRKNAGFTLVEILIVVVILGILAAIVVPQFTSASTEAVKGAIQSQLQTIESQVELFRVRNNGEYPDLGTWTVNNGWDEDADVGMIAEEYLKEEPLNGYTGSTVVVVGDEAAAMGEDRDSANGWYYDSAGDNGIFAAAYDRGDNLVAHEEDWDGTP